jgi:hypothetical protein
MTLGTGTDATLLAAAGAVDFLSAFLAGFVSDFFPMIFSPAQVR